MIISSEIKNMEKVEILTKAADKVEKSILRAFARTRAKKSCRDIQFLLNWKHSPQFSGT
jgi:Xaa-Pro aminopeptidase